jgi:hypothetical protein
MIRVPKYAVVAVMALALVAVLGVAGGASAAAKKLTASMSGAKETPKGDPNGKGTATITTNSKTGRVCYSISLSKVGKVNAGHIHKGGAGKAGPVVVPLFAKSTSKPSGCVSGIAKSLIADIEKSPGKYYVNVHNSAYPGGAVRGQLHV